MKIAASLVEIENGLLSPAGIILEQVWHYDTTLGTRYSRVIKRGQARRHNAGAEI